MTNTTAGDAIRALIARVKENPRAALGYHFLTDAESDIFAAEAELTALLARLAEAEAGYAATAGVGMVPAGGFLFSDLWDAYEAGAKSVRGHPDATDVLISRSADAYCKLKAVYSIDASRAGADGGR